jgi:CRP-like cAMP-binding protein
MENKPEYFNQIKEIFLFRDVEKAVLIDLLTDERAEIADFSAGDTIYDESNYRASLGFILSGKAEVQTGSTGRMTILNRLAPPQLFGAAGLFQEDGLYVTRIVALEDSSILFIPQDLLTGAMRKDFRLVENYLAFLSQRIRFLNRKINNFTQANAEGKLARYLLDMASDQKNDSVSFPVSIQNVAKVLHLGRASLYRALDSLSDSGYIERKGKKIIILDRPALELFCLQPDKF